MNSILEAKIREANHRVSLLSRITPETCQYGDLDRVYSTKIDSRSEEEWGLVVSTCMKCPSMRDGRCRLCGCMYRVKAFKKSWSCPKGEF